MKITMDARVAREWAQAVVDERELRGVEAEWAGIVDTITNAVKNGKFWVFVRSSIHKENVERLRRLNYTVTYVNDHGGSAKISYHCN